MQDIPYDNPSLNTVFPEYELGSNYGHCVEMYAPSTAQSIVVENGVPKTILAKGTSFAAPHVAALAARYGGPSTTPVQREGYLRSRLIYTGHNDMDAYAIRVPSFTAVPVSAVSQRLTPTSISASSSTTGSDLWSTQDSLYLSGNYWNAGATNGWIMFDLGYTRNIRSIRLVPEQSAPGTVKHQIWVGDSPNDLSMVYQINEYAALLDPIAHPLPGNTNARYILVMSNLSGISWVSWREVEIYGY
jgi:hypothetical protein